ncbi:LOW QUALITY PROTEIN: hypothetical protein V2J09_000080 [Rumex salicifolius]
MAPIPSRTTSFPLRWETTGDTWWYASPIDCAAANGHYDLVRELLRLDADHILSLTSLRRIRRLESLWDDAGATVSRSTAQSRSAVARRLLRECEASADFKGSNPLIGAGCGAWLLYTAASAGDLKFVKELLDLHPLLVFGEGEYCLTDMLYAAARSKSAEVFWALYDFAVSPRFERTEEKSAAAGDSPSGFRKEVANRAVHAAARGGSLSVLAELLGGSDGDGALSYRDSVGSTVLHAAAASGQVEVVKYLITTYDGILSVTNNEGNTALHVAAYKAQLAVIKLLLSASPSSVSATNEAGDTLLHMAVAGALSPGFERLDRHIELMKQLTEVRNNFKVEDIVNTKNNEGRTALHLAIIGNVHSDLVQHLMETRYINVNVRDDHGLTSLDYLKQQPRSSSSEMLIMQLISVGGLSNFQDISTRNAIDMHMALQDDLCVSPGTSFGVSDSEFFKYLGIEHVSSGPNIEVISHLFPSPSETSSPCDMSSPGRIVESKKRGGRLQNAAKRLKSLFRWMSMKKKRMVDDDDDDDDGYAESLRSRGSFNESPVSLREICNKRTLSLRSNTSSPTNSKKFASSVVHGIMVDHPHGNAPPASLSSSSLSDQGKGSDDVLGSSFSTEDEADESPRVIHKQGLSHKKSPMNQYSCFGLSGKSRLGGKESYPGNTNKQPIQTVYLTLTATSSTVENACRVRDYTIIMLHSEWSKQIKTIILPFVYHIENCQTEYLLPSKKMKMAIYHYPHNHQEKAMKTQLRMA